MSMIEALRFANGRIVLKSDSRPDRYRTIVLSGWATDLIWVAPKPMPVPFEGGNAWWVIVIPCGRFEPWMYAPYGWPPGEPDTRSPALKEAEEAARAPFLNGPPLLGGEYEVFFRKTMGSRSENGVVVVPEGFEYIDYAAYVGPASLPA